MPGDQFQSWAAFDANGDLRIGTFDRSSAATGSSANHLYGYTVLTYGGSGTTVSTVNSDPTQGDRWFARTVSTAADWPFKHATAFLGDYSGIAVIPGTSHVVAYWTDMRENATFAGVTRKGEDAFFGYVP